MFEVALFGSAISGLQLVLAAGWFWSVFIFAIFIVGVLLSSAENEDFIWFMIVPFIIIPWAISGMSVAPFSWAWNNPGVVFVNAVEYLVVGFAYALFRWVYLNIKQAKFVRDNMADLMNRYDSYVNNRTYPNVNMTFEEYLVERQLMTRMGQSKATIARWVVWWPFSVVAFFFIKLLIDLIKRLGELLHLLFNNSFTKIQHFIYAKMGISKDQLNFKSTKDQ